MAVIHGVNELYFIRFALWVFGAVLVSSICVGGYSGVGAVINVLRFSQVFFSLAPQQSREPRLRDQPRGWQLHNKCRRWTDFMMGTEALIHFRFRDPNLRDATMMCAGTWGN